MQASTSTDTGDLVELTSSAELDKLKKSVQDKGIVVLCCASWYEQCAVLKDSVVPEMSKIYKSLVFTWIDCEKVTDLVEKHEVDTVPTVLVFHPFKNDVDKYVNPSPDTLTEEIEKQNEYYKITLESEKERVFKEIDVILSSAPMVCFIKGTPTEPKCKFTRRLLAHTNKLNLTFKHFNILEDPKIRQWLKVYSKWQTYPQVYINKEFVGGIDVLDELVEGGEFMDMVPKECKALPPIDMFEQMLTSFEMVALVEGSSETSMQESSQSLLKALDDNSIKYVTADYTALNQEVKDHIKSKYGVETVPHLFLNGKSFGDEAKIKEIAQDGSLETVIPEGSRKLSLNDRLKKLVNSNPIMMFIKGTPQEPQCGFSRQLIAVMSEYDYEYGYFNIFEDEEVRQGLKEYSKWQTYPQLYVKGKFIGGIDIVKELHDENELEDELKQAL